MKKRNEEIFVKVLRNGFIPQLGICGPIPNPIKITRGVAHSMIVAGLKVFEFNPKTKETVELTVDNVFANTAEVKKDDVTINNVKPTPVKVAEPIKAVTFNGVKVSDKVEEKPVEKVEEKVVEKVEVPVSNDVKKEQNTSKHNNGPKDKHDKKK